MSEKDLFIGVDIGTTAVKAGLFDAAGHALAHFAKLPHPQRIGDGIVEQDPREWTSGVVAAMDAVLDGRQRGSRRRGRRCGSGQYRRVRGWAWKRSGSGDHVAGQSCGGGGGGTRCRNFSGG